MKLDYLDVDNKSAEEKQKKKEEFIERLKAAIKKQENKENKEKNKNVGTNKKKGTKGSKSN